MTKENPNYYAIIPSFVRYDKDLTPNEKLIYGEITALSNKDGFCWSKNKYFANLYDVTTQTVSRWLKHLEDKGYIHREIIRNEKNQIIKRKIFITPINKNVNTSTQKCLDPINKNVKGNITSNNTTSMNNKDTIVEKEKYEEIIGYLNELTDSKYKSTTKATIKKINGRFREGFEVEDFKNVIETKVKEWLGTEYEKYLRPSTLFRPSNFEEYLNQPMPKEKEGGNDKVSGGNRGKEKTVEEQKEEWRKDFANFQW